MEKRDGGWWRGDLGRQKKKLFPANYVEELDTDNSEMDIDNQLGQLQQGAIDLQGEEEEPAKVKLTTPYHFCVQTRAKLM